jgi:CRISPR-associated protein Cas6
MISEIKNYSVNPSQFVEIVFPVRGKTLPADHNYPLYGALTKICPAIHSRQDIRFQTISGISNNKGSILLASGTGYLRFRLPSDSIREVYSLAGKVLNVRGESVRIGIPKIFMLEPSCKLRSRLVVIKGYQEPDQFLEAAQRQLDALGIAGDLSIPTDRQGQLERKTLSINKPNQRYKIVGFSLEVSNLTEEDSISLQISGLGGKRSMGCGYFFPIKPHS